MKITHLVVGGGAAVLLVAAPAHALPVNFEAKADALLAESYAKDGPGATVIVMERGKLVYAGSRGLADLSTGRRISTETVFRLASITKQFTAAVILQLEEEGKLSLSDPVSKYLPDFPKPGADATIAQLLNHTSGIADYIAPHVANGTIPQQSFTTESLLSEFRDKPAAYPMGSKYAYSGSGYVLAGAIIQKVTGKPWHKAIKERISKPLGLTTIAYGEAPETLPSIAVPYTLVGGKVVPARPYHMSWGHAGGGLMGKIADLAKWSKALHGGKVVKPASYRKMIARTRLSGGEEVSYGLGLDSREVRGRNVIFHGGAGPGISNGAIYIPAEDLFVAILSNSDAPQTSTYTIAFRIAALAMNDPFPVFTRAEVPMERLEPLFGTYLSVAGERRLFARDGKLFLRGSAGGDVEVHAAGEDRFFYPGRLSWFQIERADDGRHVMTMYRDGAVKGEAARRSGPAATPAVE